MVVVLYGSASIRVINCHQYFHYYIIGGQLFINFVRNDYTVSEGSGVVQVCVFIGAIGNVGFSESFSVSLKTSTPSGAIDSASGM